MHREEGLSFANVVTFNLDEYYPMAPDSIHSYHRFMWENLFAHVDIDRENVHIPRGDVAARARSTRLRDAYEEAIRDAGGIDFQILGIGKTGHIGFNEPGSGAESRTRLVHLDTVTRRDAAADFFGEEYVPARSDHDGRRHDPRGARDRASSRPASTRRAIVRRAVEGEIDLEVAATFLQRHPNTTFYVDRAAAAELTRIATPWLLDEVQWTPRARWSARSSGSRSRPARRSSSSRSATTPSTSMSSLVARYGSPGAVNGEVFNALGAKIRGKSQAADASSAIICFSPHPDDDVISMGGILRKLVENENEIIVAYMTSGNIAVFDHDVRRYVDFLERLGASAGVERATASRRSRERCTSSSSDKQPGDVDIPEVQDIKRIIRESRGGERHRDARADAQRRRGSSTCRSTRRARCGRIRSAPPTSTIVRDAARGVSARDRSSSPATFRSARHAPHVQGGDRQARWPRSHGARVPRSGSTAAPGRNGRSPRPPGSCRCRRKSCASRSRRSSSTSRRRTRRPSPARTTASSGSASRRATRTRRRMLDRLGLAEYFAMEAYVVE